MKRAGRGRIVNMGSLAGKEGLGRLAAYSAASGGVIAFLGLVSAVALSLQPLARIAAMRRTSDAISAGDFALRLPTTALEEAHLAIDQDVDIQVSPGRIVIEAAVPAYDLDELLASVTEANVPDFQPMTQSVGVEIIEW